MYTQQSTPAWANLKSESNWCKNKMNKKNDKANALTYKPEDYLTNKKDK